MNQEKKSSHVSIFLTVILALVLIKTLIVTYKFAQKNYIISESKSELEKIKLLLQHGYTQEINKKDSEGKTPLWWACYNNDFELAKFLLENYTQTNIAQNHANNTRYSNNYTQTNIAQNHTNNTRYSNNCTQINIAQDLVNCPDNYGDTPLWWACLRNNLDLVNLLLERACPAVSDVAPEERSWEPVELGAQQSINFSCNKTTGNNTTSLYGLTPVAWACKNNYTQLVKLLTFHGAITDEPETYKFWPNTLASKPNSHANKLETCNWLPIYSACCNGNLKIVKYLVKNNAINNLKKIHANKINAINTGINTNTHANTPPNNIFTHCLPYTPTKYNKIITKKFFSTLYYACFDNNLGLINFTLFGPYKIFITQNHANNFFLPCLHLAALSGNTQIIKYLIENYA